VAKKNSEIICGPRTTQQNTKHSLEESVAQEIMNLSHWLKRFFKAIEWTKTMREAQAASTVGTPGSSIIYQQQNKQSKS